MNYKANIPVYEYEGELTQQLTVLFDDDLYERLEQVAVDLGLSMNSVVRTLLDHAIKHCTIEVENGDTCKTCVNYLSDDKENYVCCCERSKYFGSFRPSNSWCTQHKRR